MTGSRLDRLTPQQRAELALRLAGRGRVTSLPARSVEPAPPSAPSGSHPLSVTQYRMWLAEQVAPAASPAYTVPLALQLTGPLDRSRLRTCLNLLAERHPALRTRFVRESGVPRQCVEALASIAWETRTVSGGEAALASALADETAHVFDLAGPPPVRAALLVSGPHHHVLVLTLHHALCDGWSLGILVEELLHAYAAPGAPVLPGPAPTASHLDYARWEHSTEGRAQLTAHARYWAEQHVGHPAEAAELPFSQEAAPGDGEHIAPETATVLPPRLIQRAGTLAGRHRATVHAVWLAGFAATWHLITGARRVPLDVPAANRASERYDRTVGAFVAAMPLDIPVHPATTFAALVEQTTEQLLAGDRHAVVPTDSIALPDAPRPAAFVLTSEDNRPRPCGQLTATPLPVRVQGSQSDLTVQLAADGERTVLRLTGSPQRYTEAGLHRLAQAFLRCLEAVLSDPGAVLATVDVRDPGDRTRIGTVAAGPVAPAPPLPYDAFAHWAERTPDAFAVRDATGDLDYRALRARVRDFAAFLHTAGVRHGSAVALVLPASADYLALTLAVWHLGGWTVPLRPDDPWQRRRALLLGARVRFLVHEPGDAPPETLAGLIPLCVASLRAAPDAPPAARTRPADLAYAVFTSGTTGAPKCVAVPQGALANELAWRRREIGLAAPDRVLQTIPLSFDPSFWQCFGPLVAGAGVVFPGLDLGARPAALVDAAREHAATVVDVVPSLLASLTDDDLRRLPARVLFCGGEALLATQAERYARTGIGTLYNQYGPSEICIDATSHPYTPGRAEGVVPVGRPLPGVRLHVLDPSLRPVPYGTAGELYVGGAGVARGYVGRPAATADRFLPEPGGPVGARMYRTGDRVRWNPDGRLAFLGRSDHQVKIRGHRVELEEVDRHLADVPGVREAGTVVVGERLARLAAFVTGDPGPDPAAVRAALALTLPPHMIPAEIRVLSALPVTANGKVDRRALTGLVHRFRTASAPSRDRVTAAVLDAFAAELDLPSAGPDDHLYDLGGASLGAARIAAALSTALEVDVPVRTVLTRPRAADLAHAVAELLDAAPASDAAPAHDDGPALTAEQRQVLTLERLIGHPAPPIPLLLRLDAPARQADVEHAVRALVARHGALGPLPGAAPEPTPWQPCVLASLPADPAAVHRRNDLVEQPLPDGSPGLATTLLAPDGARSGRHVLLRLARNRGDGPSAGILADELLTLLAGGRPTSPAADYGVYARVRRGRADARRDTLEQWWRETLRTIPKDPFAARRGAPRGFRAHGALTVLPAAAHELLTARGRASGTTTTAVLLSAFANAIDPHGYGVIIGLPVSHRSAAEGSSLVGRAVDLLPVAVTAAGPGEIRRALTAALDHADLPLSRIAELVDPVDPAVRPPVCAAGLIVHEGNGHRAAVPDTPPGDSLSEHWSDLDLVLHAAPAGHGGLRLALTGATRLFALPELRARLEAIRVALGAEPSPLAPQPDTMGRS
ncbi:amino acid adenylation domain-containing protein [Streptomyces sp. NBC_01116]|uniref:non-ribosomal peptide synthetase n=1 Tax=Streptomyces sp. NBC_01116 TaxID=2903752 RepID=UPI0032541A18